MNTPIQPPQPVNPVISIQPVTASVSNNSSGGAANPLANIPAGTLIEGFVINRDAQNNPILRTSIGDLRVNSEVFLKTGSEVVFKVDTKQASLARILSVDGLSPEDYNAQNTTRAITRDTVAPPSIQTPVTSPLSRTAPSASTAPILQAILLQGQPQAATSSTPVSSNLALAQMPLLAQLAQLRSGTPLRLTLLDLKLPPLPVALANIPASKMLDSLLPSPLPKSNAPQAAQLSPASVALTQAVATPAQQLPVNIVKQQTFDTPAPAPAPSLSLEAAPELNSAPKTERSTIVAQESKTPMPEPAQVSTKPNPTGSYITKVDSTSQATMQARELSVSAPKPDVALATPTLRSQPTFDTANVVTAQVIGHDAEGANILHTSFGSVKLYTTQPLPTGTTLAVLPEIDSTPGDHTKIPLVTLDTASKLPPTNQGFASLEEAIKWVATNYPDLVQDVHHRLPQLDSKLTSNILFIISAIKTGSIEEIFGRRAIRQMELSAPELLARVRQELSQAQSAPPDAPATQWSTLTIPLLLGQSIEPIRLYVQPDASEKQSHNNGKEGQRFVLELTLSELGPIQFDGFVRKSERRRSFDLMIRSTTALDETLSETIRTLFISNMEAAGMRGQVIFQTGSQYFFKPPAVHTSSKPDDSVQTILA